MKADYYWEEKVLKLTKRLKRAIKARKQYIDFLLNLCKEIKRDKTYFMRLNTALGELKALNSCIMRINRIFDEDFKES